MRPSSKQSSSSHWSLLSHRLHPLRFFSRRGRESQFQIRCERRHNDVFSSYFVNEPVAIFEVDQPIVAFQFSTFEKHVVLSRLPHLKNIRALVPDLDSPSPIFSLGNRSLEIEIAQRMVRHLHRQSLDARLCRRTLRNRPALQDPIKLQSEIPVESCRVMLLNHETKATRQGETFFYY